jgi:hypothetical protein
MSPKDIKCEGVYWSELAHNRVQWQGLVNTVVNTQGPIKGGNL